MQDTISSGFHLANGHGYMLNRGYTAACRLNYQYYLWKQALQFNTHPSIPISGDLQIADIATGTGIWLLDLHQEFPFARLDGFDIDISNAPPPQWLPENVSIHRWSIFDTVPAHLHGKYDIIHLRLLILVVQNSDPTAIIRNVSRMLKPGGYIQWDDLNYPGTHIAKADPNMKVSAFDELRKFVYSGGRHDWVLDLPNILQENGFVDARLDHYCDRRELALANSEQHLMTMNEFADRLQKEGNITDAENIYHLIGNVLVEAEGGAGLSMPRVVVVARKE